MLAQIDFRIESVPVPSLYMYMYMYPINTSPSTTSTEGSWRGTWKLDSIYIHRVECTCTVGRGREGRPTLPSLGCRERVKNKYKKKRKKKKSPGSTSFGFRLFGIFGCRSLLLSVCLSPLPFSFPPISAFLPFLHIPFSALNLTLMNFSSFS